MPSERPNSEPTPNAEITYLATAGSEIEALMWRDALRAEGITALLRQGGPGMGAWASAATFEHALYVRADQHAAALEVLHGTMDEEDTPPLPRTRRNAPIVNRRSLRKPG